MGLVKGVDRDEHRLLISQICRDFSYGQNANSPSAASHWFFYSDARTLFLSQLATILFICHSERSEEPRTLVWTKLAPPNGNRSDMFRFAQRDIAIRDTKLSFPDCLQKRFLPREALAFRLHLNIHGASLSDIYLNFLCICVL